jgi:hypothetical protein
MRRRLLGNEGDTVNISTATWRVTLLALRQITSFQESAKIDFAGEFACELGHKKLLCVLDQIAESSCARSTGTLLFSKVAAKGAGLR